MNIEISAKSKINVVELGSRKRKIKSLIQNKKNVVGEFPHIHSNGKTEKFPVIMLDIDVPVYNMMNGRTMDKQDYFVKNNSKKSTFFSNGQENNGAQREQHVLLVHEANRGTDQNVFKQFKKIKRFDPSKPILLTNDAVIINGNRRLCTMRELYYAEGGAQKYSMFAQVPCAIVERDLSEKEFAQFEDEIQVKKDMKQPYRWINILKKTKRELGLGFTADEIAKNMGVTTKEVKENISKLEVIEEHLDKDLDEAGNYSVVEGQEQIFKDVGGLLNQGDIKGDEDKKDIIKNITRRISVSSNIEDAKSKHVVFETLLNKKNILTTATKIIKAHGGKINLDEDELGSLKDAGDEVTDIANKLHKLPIKKGNNIIQNIYEDLSEGKELAYVLKTTEDIKKKLIKINNKQVPKKDREKIVRNLATISAKADVLMNRLKKAK